MKVIHKVNGYEYEASGNYRTTDLNKSVARVGSELKNYLEKRIYRGLFISKEKRTINADLNGALNILRKEVPELQYGIEVCSTPIVYTIKK